MSPLALPFYAGLLIKEPKSAILAGSLQNTGRLSKWLRIS
jgi:hypothetical protein